MKTQSFLKFYLLWTILNKNQKKEKKCIAKELHKQFGHPYSTVLINLIIVNILLIIDNIEQKQKKKKESKCIAKELHKQFEHLYSTMLIDLIKTAGVSDKYLLDMIKDLDKSYEIV